VIPSVLKHHLRRILKSWIPPTLFYKSLRGVDGFETGPRPTPHKFPDDARREKKRPKSMRPYKLVIGCQRAKVSVNAQGPPLVTISKPDAVHREPP